MVCNPADNSFDLPVLPPLNIPGIGNPTSVPKLPIPDVTIPEGIPEDIIALIDQISALFPTGIKLGPNPGKFFKDVMDAIANLFTVIAPFLAFYKFIQAILDIIVCIIDVICALLNPFALPGAVMKLFKKCIPNFLSLFPFLALIVMIIALLLLLLAIIEYIINVIIDVINQIIQNIKRLEEAFRASDSEGILAIIRKISYLLCLIQNVFAILIALQSLLAIIQPLMELSGFGICSDKDACCGPDFCPPFIKNNPDGIKGNVGHLYYMPQINQTPDPSLTVPMDLAPRRAEFWQFFEEANSAPNIIASIITPSPNLGLTFWAEGESYADDANKIKVPYLLDMTFLIDPKQFGHTDDKLGRRKFQIKDIIIKQKPTTFRKNYNDATGNASVYIPNGVAVIGGGTVWEVQSDGSLTSYMVNGKQATLNTFIHLPTTNAIALPSTDDGYMINQIEYTFRWNYEMLVDKRLTSMMCNPLLASESAVINVENDNMSTMAKIGPMPDPSKTVAACNKCISEFRKGINEDTANALQACLLSNLNGLKDETTAYLCNAITVAANRFTSDVSVTPKVQFVTLPIKVAVTLKDKSGTQLAVKIPTDLGECIAKSITARSVVGPNGEPTLGKISEFSYDGYGQFVADLTTKEAGVGYLQAYIKDESISRILNRDNLTINSSFEELLVQYEFVGGVRPTSRRTVLSEERGGDQTVDRFDASDTSKDGS
jgi:hypothetical protein